MFGQTLKIKNTCHSDAKRSEVEESGPREGCPRLIQILRSSQKT